MYENTSQKCRTCLKNNKTTFPLNKLAIGINPKVTYGQLLKEYTRLECPPDYERLMPQYLCLLCCRELCNLYNFTRQAQYCNNKLVNIITNKLTSFQENVINIKKEKDDVRHEYSSQFYEFRIVNPNALLKSEILEERCENETPVQYYIEDVDVIEHNESDQNNTLLDNSPNGNSNNESLPCELQTICPICKNPIDKNTDLLTHIRIQHDIVMPRIKSNFQLELQQQQRLFICRKCPSKFVKKTSYQKHLKVKHCVGKGNTNSITKIINCNACDYKARTYAALSFHKRSKHGSEEDKFKCTFCSYTSLKKFSLLLHVKKSHRELIKTLKAELENKTGPLGVSREHSSLEEQTTLSTNNMNTTFHNDTDSDADNDDDEMFIRNILNIKKRHTNRIPSRLLPRRCDECGNIYKNLNALKTHKKQVHISEDKYFLCPQCGKKLKSKANLKLHIKNSHDDPKPSTSDIDKTLVSKPKPKEKRYMCTECSYVCSALTTLKIHINRHHTGEKPYKCDICFKSYIVPYELKIHRYLHTGERPYKCPVCSKGFRCNYQMIKHKRIHNNERPYKCKDCDKSFTQSYNLSLHKRKHLKEKQLNCKICDRLFENQTLLNMHCINENHHDEVV